MCFPILSKKNQIKGCQAPKKSKKAKAQAQGSEASASRTPFERYVDQQARENQRREEAATYYSKKSTSKGKWGLRSKCDRRSKTPGFFQPVGVRDYALSSKGSLITSQDPRFYQDKYQDQIQGSADGTFDGSTLPLVGL